jgi:hypothetical protein
MFDSSHLTLSEPRLVLSCSAPAYEGKEPVLRTPSDWFSAEFPKAAKKYGPPILESHRIDGVGLLHVECVAINEDFMAGILSGEDRGTRLVYYEPEHSFYYFSRDLGYFTPTNEGRLKLVLSQQFIQCATYMSQTRRFVNIGPLFQKFRSEEMLESIIDRAKAMLGVTEKFFDPSTGNRKDPQLLTGEQTAKIFAIEALESKAGVLLKIADAYEKYVEFCQSKKMPVVLHRNEFRSPAVVAVRSTWGMGLSKDLKVEGKYTSGWRNLDAKVLAA